MGEGIGTLLCKPAKRDDPRYPDQQRTSSLELASNTSIQGDGTPKSSLYTQITNLVAGETGFSLNFLLCSKYISNEMLLLFQGKAAVRNKAKDSPGSQMCCRLWVC